MKAVIMAGGEGSRLRPLTCGIPKPMVPVLNRPIMAYIVNLLKHHGFDDIGVTLQYMPEEIKSYFGNGSDYEVSMKYFIEDTPLGTAGSVKNAQQFLDETFIVISGDALTDFDLSGAINFHREKKSLVTLVLTRVSCPLEYGVVITGQDGKVRQFLEKPSWGEVFSDTVNTGIYILEPEVLDYIPSGEKYDFSKDLFPKLLQMDKPIYGGVLSGYWCDIGDLRQYVQAHYDFLGGAVKLKMFASEIQPGVFAERSAQIDKSAVINGPVYLGTGTTIGKGVKIDKFSVIGSGCIIQDNASIKRSVIWNNVFIGSGASLRGSVLCSRVQALSGSNIYEGAVIGSDSVVRERCVINPDVKLWPHKIVEKGSIVRESMVWGNRMPKRIFGLDGVSGMVNVEVTPEFASRVAAALASTIEPDAGICVSSDSCTSSRMIRDAVACGLMSAGMKVFKTDDCITPVHRFAVRKLSCGGGIHVRVSPRRVSHINLIFTNSEGGNISRNQERKIENLLAREDFKRAGSSEITEVEFVSGLGKEYIENLLGIIDVNTVRRAGLTIAAIYDGIGSGPFLEQLCRVLNVGLEKADQGKTLDHPLDWNDYRKLARNLSKTVTANGHSMGLVIDPGADHFMLVDNLGRTISEDALMTLAALMVLRSQGGVVVVPVTAPGAVDLLAERYGARVVRTKTAVQDFYEKLVLQDRIAGFDSGTQVSQLMLHFDALAGIASVLEYIAAENKSLADLVDDIPSFFMDKKEAAVPWEAKGLVIRSLIEETNDQEIELQDGVKVYHPEGWALVLPDPEEPVCRVFSEGSTMEIAESLADFYIEKINKIIGPVKKKIG